MRIRSIVSILFGMMMLFSCNRDEAVSPPSNIRAGVLWPLANGNTWVYTKELVDTAGRVFDSSTVTMSVLGPDTNEAFEGYYINNFIFSYVNPGNLLAANRSDGFYTATWYAVVPPPPPEIDRALPYPTVVGDTLTYQGLLITTRSVSSNITVAAGTFLCIEYGVAQQGVLVAVIWVAPNVGIIKTWQGIPISRWLYELQSFQLR